jgi:hypothetical protein
VPNTILRLLGLFDRPADAGCLAALRRAPAIAGLTEPLLGLDQDAWNIAITRLADLGLVKPPEPAEACQRLLDHRRPVLSHGHAGPDGRRLPARGRDRGHDFLRLVRPAEVVDRDGIAKASQFDRNRPADPAGSAGHQSGS